MNKTLALTIILFTIFVIQFINVSAYPPGDSISLGDVKVLTLYSGKFTRARRTRAIPQISCVGGSAAGRYDPDVIQCTNMGSDGIDYQWKCDTDLPDDYRLGRITVSCEGYNNPQDLNILIGSCGVEYELDYTEKGRKKVPEYNNYDRDYPNNNNNNNNSIDFTAIIAWIVVIVMFVFLVSLFCGSANTTHSSSGSSGNYGGGSGGGPYPNYPPPPYGDDKNGASAPSTGPGFWTGAATGGMLGYMFGNRNSRATSGWRTHNNSSFSSSSHSSSSSSSPSSSRTSSSYGGTKRR